MTRRSMLSKLTALIALGAAGFAAPKKWGFVDVTRHRMLQRRGIDLRVFVGGIEVTKNCYEFDDINGYCGLYKRNVDGHLYWDREIGGPAREVVTDFRVAVDACSS